MHSRFWPILAAGFIFSRAGHAQQPIAYVPTDGVSLSGSLSVENGKASIGNNGTITAGDATAHVRLARGGELRLCASTKVHLSKDVTMNANGDPSADSALMIALDRGAVEASYTPGKYSDVLLTPDLRLLISGPGQADLKIRMNQKGDTCVDNHGPNAPYVTVTSQFEGGLYRVQPNQRVMFEHGSLQQVVDNEPEPCGCPALPPVSIADAAPGIVTDKTNPIQAGQPIGGPSSTPADTAFPLAESEGLQPPPPPPSEPVAPIGVAHAQVQAPIAYDATITPYPAAALPEVEAAPAAKAETATPEPAPPQPKTGHKTNPTSSPKTNSKTRSKTSPKTTPDAVASTPAPNATPAANPAKTAATQQPAAKPAQVRAQTPPPPQPQPGLFHTIGHFFAKVFGR